MNAALLRLWWIALMPVTLGGCSMWPFAERERTSFITPGKRIAEVTSIAEAATGKDDLEQQELTHDLARRIQTEPDPLVREAIVRALRDYRTPMANRVLVAGLQDTDDRVRIACCQELGRRGSAASVRPLADVLQRDENIDVRLAATTALGEIGGPETATALVMALDDRDPALQYAGVQALRTRSDQDHGNDVAAWRRFAIAQSSASTDIQQASAEQAPRQ